MIIVKMNNSTVECSIAASELREIGLTPESIVNGDGKTEGFMNQLNHEVGQQLDYNPENEVLMMSKNMMMDGSVRIFVVKMDNDDIQNAAERIRKSARGLLDDIAQENVDQVKAKSGPEKGEALNKLVEKLSETLSGMYMPQEDDTTEADGSSSKKAISVPVSDFSSYLAQFGNLSDCIRFSSAIKKTGVVKSVLYQDKDQYFLEIGLKTREDGVTYEMRKAGMEYADVFLVNSPTEKFLEESGQCLIDSNAVQQLSLMGMAAKRAGIKKTTAKKPTAKKATAKKPTAKKTTAKKPTAKKTTAKKPTAKKATAKKATAKEPIARKSTTKKATSKNTTATKTSAKKSTGN